MFELWGVGVPKRYWQLADHWNRVLIRPRDWGFIQIDLLHACSAIHSIGEEVVVFRNRESRNFLFFSYVVLLANYLRCLSNERVELVQVGIGSAFGLRQMVPPRMISCILVFLLQCLG